MLKNIFLVLGLMLISDICLAEGQITFHPEHTSEGRTKYALGLSIYEKAAGPVYYSAWLGGGQYDEILGNTWFKVRTGLVYKGQGWKAELGASLAQNPEQKINLNTFYGTLAYKVW